MRIKYGIADINIDVTDICFNKLLNATNIITIPSGDGNRAHYFTDPVFGTLKKIFITFDDNTTSEYDHTKVIYVNSLTNEITICNINSKINNKINDLHRKLAIHYGSLTDELPEQKMVVRYLTGHEKVLEIGGNIGRNSLIIGSILGNNNNNFVTLECDPNIAVQLKHNRDLNNMDFHIESLALSNRKLIQKGWDTIASDTLLPGYTPVNIISWNDLNHKYNIKFDTLVLDCEGAFYYILMDMPEILNNISLIIMENDYHDISHKNYIDSILTKHNFYVDYSEGGGWGHCSNNFFEVWKRR
jgi:FkbM family methyltransferase